MKRNILIIKGYSKTDIELINDQKIIQLNIDYFCSNAGGAFDFDNEIIILEEPQLLEINNLANLNSSNYLIVVLIGHGANKDGFQVFQLTEDIYIQPGQIQFDCPKQLFLIESCRDIIDFELDIKKLNGLIPKYKYGGMVKSPLTRQESLEKFNEALLKADEGIVYLFASSIGESAYNYYFLQILIDSSIYLHEYMREQTFFICQIFKNVEQNVKNLTQVKQNPIMINENNTDFPFVITII